MPIRQYRLCIINIAKSKGINYLAIRRIRNCKEIISSCWRWSSSQSSDFLSIAKIYSNTKQTSHQQFIFYNLHSIRAYIRLSHYTSQRLNNNKFIPNKATV